MRGLAAIAAGTVAWTMLAACSNAQADNRNDAGTKPAAAQTQPAQVQPAATEAAAAPVDRTDAASAPAPVATTDEFREITIPAGTILHVTLDTPVGSDTSRLEQPVHGTLRTPVTVRGVEVLPSGTAVNGHVTAARRPGKVKGRGYVAMRFTNVDTPGEGTTKISTAAVGRLAPATKEKDALKIIAPAAGGAVLGRVVGGKGAARKGAVIGGAAGTGYVLSTRGAEARLGKGARLAVKLTGPVTVRVKK